MTDRESPNLENPYQAPASQALSNIVPAEEVLDPRLARRFTRLAAVAIDYVFVQAGLLAGVLLHWLITGEVTNDPPAEMFVSGLGILAIEVWLIATRGQSVGKILFRIRVVTDAHDRPPDFFWGVLVRYGLWLVPGFLYIDPWFIYGRQRKCLHDWAAGTRVVRVDPATEHA